MSPSPVQARARYESMAYSSRIEGASSHELVGLLYEELLFALTLMSHAFRVEDQAKINGQYTRATTILNALEAGLDPERGGTLAQALAGIYRSARREMMLAKTEADSSRIEQLIDAFSDMAESWKRIAA